MRVSPRELQAVRRAGMVTRYAMLGPVAYVLADLPPQGTAGTGLDEPCLIDHHGMVLRGTFRAHHEDGRTEAFEAGTVFYVPAGPPSHHFSWTTGSVVGGFAPVAPETDVRAAALEAQGFEILRSVGTPPRPPASVTLAGAVAPFRRAGSIDVEGSVMGRWLFMRSIFGAQTGMSAGWCDLPHWGVVIAGEVAIHGRDSVELASEGDAFITEPGHRFEVPDGATVLDYTPLDALEGSARIASWRRAAISRALASAEGAKDEAQRASAAIPLRRPAPSLRGVCRPHPALG